MSEIDKLINQAFPDELRDIEPINVDEDAILAMTLESLGLEQPVLPELPAIPAKPLRRLTGRLAGSKKEAPGLETQPGLIEVPVVVRHRWVDLAGWAIAACLVLVCAVNWGPWLISNLDFGIGPRSSGDIIASEGGDASSGTSSTYLVTKNNYYINVIPTDVSYGDDTVTITLTFVNGLRGSELDLDQIDIKLESAGAENVTRVSRSNSEQQVILTYDLHGARSLTLTVRLLVPLLDENGEEVGLAYQDIDTLDMDLKKGSIQSRATEQGYFVEVYGTVGAAPNN